MPPKQSKNDSYCFHLVRFFRTLILIWTFFKKLVRKWSGFDRSKPLSLNKFLDPSTPSMRNIDDGERKKKEKEKKKKENNGGNSCH